MKTGTGSIAHCGILVLSSVFAAIFFLIAGCSGAGNNDMRMTITQEPFGTSDDGREAVLFTLTNRNGMEASITNYGGIIVSLKVPDREGNLQNIVHGFDELESYLAGHPFFGALVGRYANRIAGARFELEGTEYQLAANDGDNHLHGGEKGFDKVLWEAEVTDDQTLRLSYLSPDGEEGYPGNLEVTVIYTLTDDNELKIEYEAETDRPTPVNLTSHSYFNLSGDPSSDILDHELTIHAEGYTPVDEELIPVGEIRNVEGTPFDFRTPVRIGERIDQVDGGYDHNFVLNGENGELNPAAELHHPESGRSLTLFTTEPGLQFYSGNFLDGSLNAPDGTPYEKHSGLCLEPQHFPNSPNEPEFPSVILHPGETYRSVTVYLFSVE